MSGNGQLTIETANTYLDEAYVAQFGDVHSGQYVLLSVSDTGTGISPDVLPRVFEPFFTIKTSGEGSGLGLAMVHGFVKQSGGHVRIYSEAGHGTTVKIYLPRFAEAKTVAAVPRTRDVVETPVPRARPGESILVVEDNDGVRDYATSSLQDLGYRVLEARNAAEALQILNVTPVELLFTDVVLPETNGRELARQARAGRDHLAVLFTTGYTTNAIIHQGRLDPDVQLLGKPYTQQSLGRKVREVLDRQANVRTGS